jgi:hypothetical protein
MPQLAQKLSFPNYNEDILPREFHLWQNRWRQIQCAHCNAGMGR